MATRRILLPWTSQPPCVTGVNRAHPAAADLSFLFNGSTGIDAVDPAGTVNRAGNNVLQPGREGTGFLTNDSGWWEFSDTQIKRNPTELSILLVFAYTRHTAYDACKFYTGRTWTANSLGTECYYNGGNIVAGATGAGDLNLGASAGVGATKRLSVNSTLSFRAAFHAVFGRRHGHTQAS